ncbi:MAG: hypothetical protein UFG06_13920 [Lachnospiraceae bacterium]|nr:hypothetical protein [Lachnospiraceae bacterium]
MNDLISRQIALRNIKEVLRSSLSDEHKIVAEEIYQRILHQPAAYDVGEVVEQIKNLGTKLCTNVHCNNECSDCDHGVMMISIINEVKAGGVNG